MKKKIEISTRPQTRTRDFRFADGNATDCTTLPVDPMSGHRFESGGEAENFFVQS